MQNFIFISVDTAREIIFKHMPVFGEEEVNLTQASFRILTENIYADRDLPPFNKSLMDGIAIKYEDFKTGIKQFEIIGTQAAGQEALKILATKQCTEIMTGAVVSQGANCVVPIEDVEIAESIAVIKKDITLNQNQNIRWQGQDQKKGQCLISKNAVLTPERLAIAASVGKHRIKVNQLIRAAIISNGDELVDIDSPVKPFQIRKSNSYFLKTLLERSNSVETELFHFPDNEEILFKEIAEILKNFDIVILTGGVSMGKFDFIPRILKKLSVKLLFHKVQQKPGKPFWFGIADNKVPVFALPGNPIATQVCAYKYVLPGLDHALGIKRDVEYAMLSNNAEIPTALTYFMPIKITSNDKAQLVAKTILTGGSGDLGGVAAAQGFMQIPPGLKHVQKGFVGEVIR